MKEKTLCFPVTGNPISHLLLGFKKKGFGTGKFNGFGGHVKSGEDIRVAAVRELEEESGITACAGDLEYVGCLFGTFPARGNLDQIVHIFLLRRWAGDPVETAEMIPRWFEVIDAPFEQMWEGDYYWLPYILRGGSVSIRSIFKHDNKSIDKLEVEVSGVQLLPMIPRSP